MSEARPWVLGGHGKVTRSMSTAPNQVPSAILVGTRVSARGRLVPRGLPLVDPDHAPRRHDLVNRDHPGVERPLRRR